MQATLEAAAVDSPQVLEPFRATGATLRPDTDVAQSCAGADADADAAADLHGVAVATAVVLGLTAGVIAAMLMMLGYATT